MGPRQSGSAVIMPAGERKMLHCALKISPRCLVVSGGHTGMRPPKQLAVAPEAEECRGKGPLASETWAPFTAAQVLALCGSLLLYL